MSLMNGLLTGSIFRNIFTDIFAGSVLFTIPEMFQDRWTPSFNIYENGRTYTTDFDISTVEPTGTTYYVTKAGNDTTGDGSSGSPYRTLAKAYTEGADVVMVGDGVWNRSDGFAANFNPNRDFAVKAINKGKAIITRAEAGLSWTQQGSPNSDVYLTSRSAVRTVIDTTAAGRSGETLKDGTTPVPIPLESVGSVAACQAQAGSYFTSGSNLYVHTHDSREPDADVLVLLVENIWAPTGDITIYLEGYEGWGDSAVRLIPSTNNTAILAWKDSASRFGGSTADQFETNNISEVYSINCECTDNEQSDAFNYHADQIGLTTRINALEVNCRSRRNGNTGASNDNGSTCHDNCNIIRLNCDHQESYGPTYADVLGAYSLNFGCTGGNSLATGTNQSAFLCGNISTIDGNATKMWVKNCTFVGTGYALSQNTGGVIFDMGGNIDNTTLGNRGTIIDVSNQTPNPLSFPTLTNTTHYIPKDAVKTYSSGLTIATIEADGSSGDDFIPIASGGTSVDYDPLAFEGKGGFVADSSNDGIFAVDAVPTSFYFCMVVELPESMSNNAMILGFNTTSTGVSSAAYLGASATNGRLFYAQNQSNATESLADTDYRGERFFLEVEMVSNSECIVRVDGVQIHSFDPRDTYDACNRIFIGGGDMTFAEPIFVSGIENLAEDTPYIDVARYFMNEYDISYTSSNIILPLGFGWTPSFPILKTQGIYHSGYSLADDIPAEGTGKFINKSSGSDSNNGDTSGTAYASLQKANDEGANTYYISTGDYLLGDGFDPTHEFTRDTSLIAVDGPGTVRLISGFSGADQTWTDEGDGVYSATYRGSVTSLTDINVIIDYTNPTNNSDYTLVDGTTDLPVPMGTEASQAALGLSSGHAYYDPDSTVIYVKTHDSREPDSDVIFIDMQNLIFTTNQDVTIYAEGIEFWGRRAVQFGNNIGADAGKFIGYRSGFRYGDGVACLYFDGVADTRLIECEGTSNKNSDGISYNNNASGAICRHLELGCKGLLNGDNNADQGSTGHDNNVFIIRLEGTYNENGRGTEETENSQSVNYGCTYSDNDDYGIVQSAGGEVWYADATFSGNGTGNTSGGVTEL